MTQNNHPAGPGQTPAGASKPLHTPSGPVLPWEALGGLLSLAALGLTLFFSVTIDGSTLDLREEIVRFADAKALIAILLLFAGVGVGSLVSNWSAARNPVAPSSWNGTSISVAVIDAIVILAALYVLIDHEQIMTLTFWFLGMIGLVVVPAVVKSHQQRNGGWVMVRVESYGDAGSDSEK